MEAEPATEVSGRGAAPPAPRRWAALGLTTLGSSLTLVAQVTRSQDMPVTLPTRNRSLAIPLVAATVALIVLMASVASCPVRCAEVHLEELLR
jgi:hypothetical protein